MPKYLQTESNLIAGDDATLKQLVVEARAKVIWGERIADVRQWLSGHGLADSHVALIIETCVRERRQTIRDRGKDDLIKGGLAVLCGGAVVILLIAVKPHMPALIVAETERKRSIFGLFVVASYFLAAYGLLRFSRGVYRLCFASTMTVSIPDMD